MRSVRFLLVAVLVVATSACAAVDELFEQAGDTVDNAQFCLAVTRALSSLESGTTPEQAAAAAEEVLTTAPAELRDDAEVVADGLRRARDGDEQALSERRFRGSAERLRERTRELCDPTR